MLQSSSVGKATGSWSKGQASGCWSPSSADICDRDQVYLNTLYTP